MEHFIESMQKAIEGSIAVKQALLEDSTLLTTIESVSDAVVAALRAGGKVLFCGNGGGAADAQHLAAELAGKFYFDREPLFAEALHVNTWYITAVANDYSYDEAFSRLVRAKGRAGDVLFCISTSGNSSNIVRAAKQAVELGVTTVAMTGADGGELAPLCSYRISVGSNDTPRIQETHILIGHIVCEGVERMMFPQ